MNLREVSIDNLPLVGPTYAKKLERLGIATVWDLFHHVPFRFLDFTKNINISDLEVGETATVKGTVTSSINQYTKKGKPMQIITIADETGKVNAIWFNQIYLLKTFREGYKVAIAGELNWFGRTKAIISPEYEILNTDGTQIHTGGLIPIYSETAGVSSKWLRRRIHDAWKRYENDLDEFLPENILKRYNLIGFKEALAAVHFPKTLEEFESGKRRLAFNELLSLHTTNLFRKKKWEEAKIKKPLKIDKPKLDSFTTSLPFSLTSSQQKVTQEILSDLAKDIPMNRLLEGDVGSGKTVVAAIAAYALYLNNKKTVLLAPTQILANQHYKTLGSLFKNHGVKIGLFTASVKSSGDFDILVGTHALLNKGLKIKNASLIVIDEQHKFGVKQRNLLTKKTKGRALVAPHVLTMTATPIPRTVALTFFGDLNLSVLDELPAGRQKIVTWIVPKKKREPGFIWVAKQIKENKTQAYVVCPLIDESDAETLTEVKAVKKEYEDLKNKFKDLKFGLLHGRLKVTEKDAVVEDFKGGKLDVLVSTPVVEVGVDISNATIMVIEAADRFGLASLHQLRGRVGRGKKRSYCLLLTENESDKTQVRLTAMTKYNSGFALSEIDLALRGPGEIYGTRQSGIPELRIADWNDLEMIKNTRDVAERLANKI